MIEYLMKYPGKILDPLFSHIQLTLITILFSLILAVIITIIAVKWDIVGKIAVQIFSIIYSIPSLALFAILIPVTGLGKTTAILVMTIYNQYLLLRNFLTGLDEVDPGVLEAARGMGMTDMQRLWKIQVPLSKRALFAGLRLAVVSTIGIGTIAATINAGGLGVLLFDGLRTMNTIKILWGSLLSALLAISLNYILKYAENKYDDYTS